MGYCMQQQDSKFEITVEKKADALTAIKELMSEVDVLGGGGSYGGDKPPERWFSWVDTQEVLQADTLEKAFDAWRWEVEDDDQGNIIGIMFCGEKAGDDEFLFNAIAPFVTEGSYIDMRGEDNYNWRYKFQDGKVKEIAGVISYPEE